MKLRFLSSILIFISAYSPLSIIFLIQNLDLKTWSLQNPLIIWSMVAVSVLSCTAIWASVRFTKVSTPPVTILSVMESAV